MIETRMWKYTYKGIVYIILGAINKIDFNVSSYQTCKLFLEENCLWSLILVSKKHI